jgi:hypothetical protein
MQAGQLKPGDVIEYTEMELLRACDRKVKRTRRWLFVSYVRLYEQGWFVILKVTDLHGQGEFGLCQREWFDWKVLNREHRPYSDTHACVTPGTHDYTECRWEEKAA